MSARTSLAVVAVALGHLIGVAGVARATEWMVLGQQTFGADGRAVVPIDRGNGRAQRLRLEAVHGELLVEAIRVICDNGASERLRIGIALRVGQSTPSYDLAGYGRRVEAVEVVGQAGPAHGGRSLIRVLGEAVAGAPGLGERRQGSEPGPRIKARSGPTRAVVLDRQRIDPTRDQHILRIADQAAVVTALRVRAQGAAVHVRSLLIVHDDGSSRETPIGQRLAPSAATALIALDEIPVREVVVVIEPMRGLRSAGLDLEGMIAVGEPGAVHTPQAPDGWTLLGTGAGIERDTIRVGIAAGRFKSVALRVAGGHVVLGGISIVYPDGRRDTYPVDKEIPDGTFTPGIALKGGGAIDRIELVYAGGTGGATVDVYGEDRRSAELSVPRAAR
ncbi:MAG: hypothetical protein ACOYLQ_13000 [Hyphomicrobiaceae bacterium]